jgi:hypothetical protein
MKFLATWYLRPTSSESWHSFTSLGWGWKGNGHFWDPRMVLLSWGY